MSMLTALSDVITWSLSGPGVSEVDFHFLIISYGGECQELFSEWKIVATSQSYRDLKYMQLHLHCACEL